MLYVFTFECDCEVSGDCVSPASEDSGGIWVSRVGGPCAGICPVQCDLCAFDRVSALICLRLTPFAALMTLGLGSDRFDTFVTVGLFPPLFVVLFVLFFDLLYGCR